MIEKTPLTQLMEATGTKLRELAKAAKTDESTAWRYVNGVRKPSARELGAMVRVMKAKHNRALRVVPLCLEQLERKKPVARVSEQESNSAAKMPA